VKGRHGHLAGHYYVPPVLAIFGFLIANCLIYGLLAWFFDKYLPYNRGGTEPLTRHIRALTACCRDTYEEQEDEIDEETVD